jgi:simple sugar transport system permease protein
LNEHILTISKRFGLAWTPPAKIYTLSVGEKQTVEILKVLYRGSRILILDEPRRFLTPQEIEKLFIILRKMRDEGCAVIIITHKLNEVLAISDRVITLRKGEVVGTVETKDADARSLTEQMVGRAVDLSIARPEPVNPRPALAVENLRVAATERNKPLCDISFTLMSGEILGVAGVAGSGQKELCEAIAGLQPASGGSIRFEGEELRGLSPREIAARGVAMSFVPEDRLGMGLVGSMGMVDNMLLKKYQDQRAPLLDRRPARTLSNQLIERLSIMTPDVYTPVKRLSGGNVQKVLLGREIASDPKILITAYRVRGLDINSSMTIYRLAQRAEGPRRGGPLHRRGPGRAIGAVRPHHGHVRRNRHGPGRRQGSHQGAVGPDDDRLRAGRRRRQMRDSEMKVRTHIVQRVSIDPWRAALYRVLAIVLALATGGLFLLAVGFNPFPVYGTMVGGAVGSAGNLRETIKIAIPLLITSLGVTLAFKMRFWNIGAEAQLSIGAVAASFFALTFPDWPQPLLLTAMAAAGFLAGGLWGLVPAWFKARFGTNETLFTLMMNYIAIFIIQLMREGPWRDPRSGFPKVPMFDKAARMPQVLGVHAGWIVALVLVALVYVYLKRTKQGYELTVVGENENTARYAGMNVKKIILRTVFLSAAIAGLAGMLQASGADRTLTETVAGGVGFTAITVSWLSQLSPPAILVVSMLFACLQKGSGTIRSIYNISPSTSEVFQGIILFFVLGAEFFINYKIVWGRKGGAGL